MAGFKTFTLLIFSSLILSASTSLTGRNPYTTTTSSLTRTEFHITVTHSLAPMGSKDEEEGILGLEEEKEDGDCSGLEMEECLMRRSMAAHTDYIYTQDINYGP